MNQHLKCAKGHTWLPTISPDETTVQPATVCPVCGGQGKASGQSVLAEPSTREMTLGDDGPHLDDVHERTTVAMADVPPPADLTAATMADVKVDAESTVFMDGAAPPPQHEDATTALLTPGDLESSDRTAISMQEEGELDQTEVVSQAAHDQATEAEIQDQTQPSDIGRGPNDRTAGQTQATELGQATGRPAAKEGGTGKHRPVGTTKGRTAHTAKAGVKLPRNIAGYEILGELGRGGMGVVYKARQTGLNRLCALKMILGGGLASADAVARFGIEAEAIAKLQHPNIVQVYEIGEVDGCPFFTLEFVDGTTLQAKIAATPQAPADTARMMQQICNGVHAAHMRGVLHRDLKPANVLLTKDNVPKITDFGLAKQIEEQDHGRTRSGAILGTPSYMAPEQAMGRAKDVGPPADIYSLGAIVYDMLTGRPPFRGETVMDTLNQVQKLEPLPPARLVPKIPIDLQTICLKALQKEPKKRYATAGDMAEDFRRYLANEPILARPTPAWERLAKWIKRRPALATMIGVSTLAVLCILTLGGLWLNSRAVAAEESAAQSAAIAKAEEDRANEQTARAKAEHDRADEKERFAKAEEQLHREAEAKRALADKNLGLALNAVDEMLTRIGGNDLRFEPRMELVRRDLLAKALHFYLEFLKDAGTDPSVRFGAALAEVRVGFIYRELGDYENALKHYQLALNRFSDLEKEDAKELKYRQGVAMATMERAFTWQLQNRFQESEKGYLQALDLFKQIAKEYPNQLLVQDELANLYDDMGTLCLTLGRLQEANTSYDKALSVRTALNAKSPTDPELRKRLARLNRNRAALFGRLGNIPEAEKALKSARSIAKKLTQDYPDTPDYKYEWAASCKDLAICDRKLGRPQAAADDLRESIEVFEELKTDYPRTPEYRQELAKAIYDLGMVEGEQKHFQAAYDQFHKALDIQEKLFAKYPALAETPLRIAKSHISLGIVLVNLDDLNSALDQYRQGVDRLEKLKPVAGKSPNECDELARGYANLASVLVALSKPIEADQSYERLLRVREELVKAFPKSLERHVDMAATDKLFGERFQKADKAPQAATHFVASAAEWARCMNLIETDQTHPAEARMTLAKAYAEKAMTALKQAKDSGFKDANYLKTAPEFRLLRENNEFQRLVSEIQPKRR